MGVARAKRAGRWRRRPRWLSVQFCHSWITIPILLLIYTAIQWLGSILTITFLLWHCKTNAPEHSLLKIHSTLWKQLEFNLVKNRPRGAILWNFFPNFVAFIFVTQKLWYLTNRYCYRGCGVTWRTFWNFLGSVKRWEVWFFWSKARPPLQICASPC